MLSISSICLLALCCGAFLVSCFSFGGQSLTLAVDYGTKRVGLAVGVGIAPRPLATIQNTPVANHTALAHQVIKRAKAENPNLMDIVVGLPLHRNGSESYNSELCRNFSQVLAREWKASRGSKGRVMLFDERFTSKEAEVRLTQATGGHWVRGSVDSVAASCLLEHYFDEGGRGAELVVPESDGS